MTGAVALVMASCSSAGTSPTAQTSDAASVEDLDTATLAYIKDTTDAIAEQLKILDPPDVKAIRLISLNEWAPTQIACLNEEGHNVTETADGQGITYPPYQDASLVASLNLAIYTCEAKYPTQQKYMTPLSDEGLKELYAYRAGALVDCLEGAGYAVAGSPPSEALFVESGGKWSPYESISLGSDLKELFNTCPQSPDSVYGK